MYLINDAKIVGTTVVTSEFAEIIPDIDKYYPAEAVIEYASRLCYNSNDKFGTNPNFIKGLIKAGHLDVLEHSAIAIRFELTISSDADFYKELFEMKQAAPYLKFYIMERWDRRVKFAIAGNIRAFYEYLEWGWEKVRNNWLIIDTLLSIEAALYTIAPNIYTSTIEQNPNLKNLQVFKTMQNEYERIILAALDERDDRAICVPVTSTGAIVQPIGFMNCNALYPREFNQSAYLVNNVSRAFSHQHVRHRLLSFSQMSQRYVDYTKQGDGFVYPTNLTTEQAEQLDSIFGYLEVSYELLRNSKMKKEDARVVLPNAAITHLVFSGFQDGLDHYIKLRTASDAQEEIRLVAERVAEHNKALLWRI